MIWDTLYKNSKYFENCDIFWLAFKYFDISWVSPFTLPRVLIFSEHSVLWKIYFTQLFSFSSFQLILLALVTIALAAPARDEDDKEKKYEIVPIIKSEINKNEDGSYKVEYEGGDGTSRQEEATVIDAGTENESLEVKGSYKYINDEGQEVEVTYTAGVNGFVPHGSIINSEISAVAEAAQFLPKQADEEEKKAKST